MSIKSVYDSLRQKFRQRRFKCKNKKCKELESKYDNVRQYLKQIEQEKEQLQTDISMSEQLLMELESKMKQLSDQQEEMKRQQDEQAERKRLERQTEKEVSKAMIQSFVKEMLEDKDININGFPDAIERKMYENVFTILIGIMDKLLQSSSVRFFNHEIVFDVRPIRTEK